MAEDTQADLTIEQLAHETGMSVRNIRNHQSRGLLPPPEVRARIGYYGREHVVRLRLILELQSEGFNLAAIERLLSGERGLADRLPGLRQLLLGAFEGERPQILSAAELAEKFGPPDPRNIEKARKLGFLIPVGEDRFEAPSPALLQAAEDVLARGIELGDALEVIETVQRNARSVSRAFVKLFLDDVWKPFVAEGQPESGWDEISATIEELERIATEALVAVFKQTMATEVEVAFGKILEHQARKR